MQHHVVPAPPPGRRDFLERYGLGPKGGFQTSAASRSAPTCVPWGGRAVTGGWKVARGFLCVELALVSPTAE